MSSSKYCRQRSAPVLIVTSRVANHSFWAEVLKLGGYDVLAQPLDREEVTRVIAFALRASSAAFVVPAIVRVYFRVVRSRASISSGER
jgi:DNA-binding response OmpR family regulator